MPTSPPLGAIESGRLRHDGMYRFLAVWDAAGDFDRDRLYRKALQGCPNTKRAPKNRDAGAIDALVRVSTVLMGLHTGDQALLLDLDTSLLATDAEKNAFGCFVSTQLPGLVDALHQGALAQHAKDHTRELALFCGAAMHAWMCQV